MSSIFDGIEKARSSEYDGNYVRPGVYAAEIVGVKETQNHAKVKFVAIEMKITSVIRAEDGGHKEGEDITHLLKVAVPNFLGNFKQFVSVALEVEPDDVSEQDALRVLSDEQPLSGYTIAFKARNTTTRAGDPFTKVTYLSDLSGAHEESKGGE